MKKMLFTLAATLLTATTAVAGPGHELKPNYGGIPQEVRDITYELVARADSLAIYTEDHGKKVPTAGGSARLTLLNGTEKSEVTLSPAGDNKLEAKGSFKVQAGTRVIAVVTLAGKAPVTVRYAIK